MSFHRTAQTIILIASSIIHHFHYLFPEFKPRSLYLLFDKLLPVIPILYVFPNGEHIVVPLLRPLTLLLQQWPKIVPTSVAPRFLINGGPLGKYCGKVCEVVAAYILLYYQYGKIWPDAFRWKLYPLVLQSSWKTWAILTLLSTAVNVVLSVWSKSLKSRGDHDGVNSMVSSFQSSLSVQEHLFLCSLAFINAACEETVSRGFFLHEFLLHFSSFRKANVCQSLAFGVWHFHGIPSGWTGVGLTFVYGFIMGELWRYYGGALGMPILAHTVADYFIFSVIARRQTL